MSEASPTTPGNAVRKVEYVAGFRSPPAFCWSAVGGFSSACVAPAAFAGSGQTIAWTNVPVIWSPTIRTADTLPPATCPTNALYGSATWDVCVGRNDQMFQTIAIAKMIHESGPKRY